MGTYLKEVNNLMKLKRLFTFLSGIFCALLLMCCNDHLGSSPDPAVLRIYLVTNPADTTIQIGFDSLTVTTKDDFSLTISQMKVYSQEGIYAKLFSSFSGYKDEETEYNLLERQSGSFIPQKIVESHIPPNQYQRIEFVVYPPDEVTIHGLTFPIDIPEGYKPLITMECPFIADENEEHNIYIQFNAFKSIKRWRDTYIFTPSFELINK
ncbi:protein of unknown function (DUF4382) [Caldithrix abyssi DSM 13497]|uniref:DUF4382 domain-containing protein n=2 Tax=Caldithrix abyssi DSM 13497 TaxID=880073 RepID=A0A1J1CA38_CALAY|nr:protein of unknown function (DUF4382) [Caldithrix abyssi DSM 13497]